MCWGMYISVAAIIAAGDMAAVRGIPLGMPGPLVLFTVKDGIPPRTCWSTSANHWPATLPSTWKVRGANVHWVLHS